MVVLLGQVVLGVTKAQLQQRATAVGLRERDVNPLLESSSDGGVQVPRSVCGAQDQNALHAIADALHLGQELRLDTSCGVRLTRLAARTAQGVHLIDEDDRRPFFSCHFEERLDQLLTFAHPLGDQVRRRDGKKRGSCLCSARLRQVRLSSAWRPIEQNAVPWLPLALKELGELHRQYHALLQRVLSALQARNVAPLDIRLRPDDRPFESGPQLCLLAVFLLCRGTACARSGWRATHSWRGNGCAAGLHNGCGWRTG
mmetsp:Transcript_22091/g.61922  ORF Transcript_22091/g.61922 Transcript_22091/m.61922 type:complete len:257 (-) Transcript_22091:246-1016(-)